MADDPPPALVDRLALRFQEGGGNLPAVYRTLIEAPESAQPAPGKFKTPWDWLVSSMRGLGLSDTSGMNISGMMQQLGQPVWKPGSPAGYDDIAASWAGPDALVRRVEASERFATRAGATIDARALAPKLFPGALTSATEQALARAESPGQALALLLVSPEMLRR